MLNRKGFDRALAAQVDEANFVVVASETFNRRNQGVSIAETMAQIADTAGLARLEGLKFGVTIGASFGCPFEGEVAGAQVVALAREAAAMGVCEIALADTIGVADPVMGEVGRAYVIAQPGSGLTEAEVRRWCAEHLADYKVPRQVSLRDALPMTPAGKIHKAALRDEVAA